MLRDAGIDPHLLDNPDAQLPTTVVQAFLAGAVHETGRDNLGLHLAENADLASGDVHAYAMLSSPTLGEAYHRVCRFQRLIHETTRVELEAQGDITVLRHTRPGGLAVPRQTAEFLLAIWVRCGRVATGTDWSPTELRFAHAAPSDIEDHRRFFRAPLRFSTAENALVLPTSLLELPCPRADPALLQLLDRYAGDRLDSAPKSDRLADRARAVLAGELRGSEPSAERLAGRLKMSRRTLNRALAAEGTSYRQLLDQLRRELVERHLAEDRLSIAEVAFLAGFSELSAFYRAFKRWNGGTPAEFRSARLRPVL